MIEISPITSVTLAPLVAAGLSVQQAAERAASAGFRSVQLSAAAKGLRPRELDQRARRDVLMMLSRAGLMLGGLDLMIPRKDWTDAATQERAVDAALAAMGLAADMGRVPLSMTLPVGDVAGDIRKTLLDAADGRGVVLAIHAEDQLDALLAWLDAEDQPVLGAALDPAALLAADIDPTDAMMKMSKHVLIARLDDYARPSVAGAGGRCLLGEGELDMDAYRAVMTTLRHLRGLVVELRDLPDPIRAMQHVAGTV
ncbi:MAG: TIM barrel protein [Planctomycetes bacterium]|nr:TIM barrel protein [Planctomycetota bacterium]